MNKQQRNKQLIRRGIATTILFASVIVNIPLGIQVFTNCPKAEVPEEKTIEEIQNDEYGFNPVVSVVINKSTVSEIKKQFVLENFEISTEQVEVVSESIEETEIVDITTEIIDTTTKNLDESTKEDEGESDENCTPLNKNTKIKSKYVDYCEKVASEYKDIDAETLIAMIEKETGGKNQQVKRKGATYQGLTMINPKYQKARMEKLGIKSLMDEYSNILCCADILQENYDKYGSMRLAIIGFNAGEYSSMFKNAKKNGTSTKYCKWVMNRAKELKQ